ncbi:MAG: hypothetical protein JRN11_00305 [Nitrososphaerota archaeon]|nr:hypothetical protein [Nitrososphaerota archaeon]
MKVLRENPGLTEKEIAANLGRQHRYVDSMLWRLREHAGAGGSKNTTGASNSAAG